MQCIVEDEAVRKPTELDVAEEAPLYIRWSPDRSAYAIELRLDLVSKIDRALAEAAKQGIEIGGVLVGSAPDPYMPTLRIEDVELLPRESGASLKYLADSELEAHFTEIRWSLRASGKAAVGLFRSNLRNATLRPSLADRGLLSTEFKQGVYAALLIQGRSPHLAAFFVANNGQLPDEPAVREFQFNEAEFRALPEVEPGSAEAEQKPAGWQRWRIYAIVATLLLIGAAACLLMWSFTKQQGFSQWLHSGHQLHLAVTGNDTVLRISWNHAARELDGAAGATLVIDDGGSHREIKLGLDELRLGAVEYERSTPHVQVKLTVDKLGAAPQTESAGWDQK